MPYGRYLDLHFAEDFRGTATFQRDVANQEAYQRQTKGVDYRKQLIHPISITRNVRIVNVATDILWVCQAGGDGGKIRINAHGDGLSMFNNTSDKVAIEQVAIFLKTNGLLPEKLGHPGLRTINLAICNSAKGEVKDWMIKELADLLALPDVTFTGADGRTNMSEDGILKVNNPDATQAPGSTYVIPRRRYELFKSSSKKNSYTVGG